MDEYYYEVTSEIDAREVLRYLNNLGIHNISGEILKYFITDLKKYIKYDLERQTEDSNDQPRCEIQGPERLHSASTFSSRTKSKVQDGQSPKCLRECEKARKPFNIRNTHSAPNIGQHQTDVKPRRTCSCVRVEKKPDTTTSQTKGASSSNLIKVQKQPNIKKCDPVSLYHYYTSMWEKYKSNVPGENDWADLRWKVRQKMAGNCSHPISSKAPDSHPSKDNVGNK